LAIRFVCFDCMETIVQLEVPSFDVYADWIYGGGLAELGLWNGPEGFRAAWKRERELLNSLDGGHREGTILGRIEAILDRRIAETGLEWPPGKTAEEARRVHRSFWGTYRSMTFVLPEVAGCLDAIEARRVPMGIVSNFMVEGGIEDLLRLHDLARYFREVVVSCRVGWRKPSERIYRAAIEAARVAPEEILFVGDTPIADHDGPMAAGMRTVLYDRKGIFPDVEHRVGDLREVPGWIDRF
jgi:putative hydrolase of the HAD superfamily